MKLKIKFWTGIIPLLLFCLAFVVYFGVGTDWTFSPLWDLDFFNLLAQSLLQGRLDIALSGTTYDLSYYQGKYYPYWGLLPALLLIPLQILKGRFVPTLYLSVFFGSLNVLAVYFLLRQVKREFLPRFSSLGVLLVTLFFAFGTTHFYLSTLSGVWHVAQVVSFLPATVALLFVFRKKRHARDYLIASFLLSLNFFGRLPMVGLLTLPGFLWLGEKREKKLRCLVALIAPLVLFFLVFCWYNLIRFNHPLETGYRHALYHPFFEKAIQRHGVFSLSHAPRNLWYLFFEVPALSWDGGVKLRFNLEGNSIFFLSPPLLAAFLAFPWRKKPYLFSLWLAVLAALFPSLIIYSTGWMQFGYRYSLDFMALFLLLSVFGVNGRFNLLYFLGVVFSCWMQVLGITALR